jgi:ring-1,2-phenylacetyl-CoA epoxidase subunit PaaE
LSGNNNMALKFQKLRVAKVIRETPDAVSICFENPDKSVYTYIPGQYLTLKVDIDGKPYNRAYSLSSCPFIDEHLTVTVKVTPGGKASTWLHDRIKPGDTMDILPPLGNFTAKIDPSHSKHYVLIGAGSGITPLMSILRSVLGQEKQSRVTLIFGNRTSESIIFNTSLTALQAEHGNRLNVIHSLTQPPAEWTGKTGRLNRDSVKSILANDVADTLPKEYFICGPSGMMDEAANALKEMGVSPSVVHEEHFSAPLTHPMEDEKPKESAPGEIATRTITVIMDGKEVQITVKPSESVLDAALDHDLDPPYACMIGSCCTCKAKLLSGKVVMDDREGLTDSEIADGYVLTCQSHPMTDNVKLSYDEI